MELVNGRGSLAKATVSGITKHSALLEVLSVESTPIHPPRYILAIPLMRPSKLELIIEKCTELGADAFWLYPAQFSDKDDLSANQQERLTHVAISAMKQCGRLDLPSIQIIDRFEGLFSSIPAFFGERVQLRRRSPLKKRLSSLQVRKRDFQRKN